MLKHLTLKVAVAAALLFISLAPFSWAATRENDALNNQKPQAQVSTTPYELTAVDLFNIKDSFSSDTVSVLGITLDSSLQDVLAKLKLSEKDISKREGYLFLEVKPGFRLRLKESKIIDALIIGKEFQPTLKGDTAKFFDSGSTSESFVEYIKRFFPNPSDVKSHSDGSFIHDSVGYKAGFEFIRVGVKNKPTLIIQIIKSKPGAVMRKN